MGSAYSPWTRLALPAWPTCPRIYNLDFLEEYLVSVPSRHNSRSSPLLCFKHSSLATSSRTRAFPSQPRRRRPHPFYLTTQRRLSHSVYRE